MDIFINRVFRYMYAIAGGTCGGFGVQMFPYIAGFRTYGTAAHSIASYVQSKLVHVSLRGGFWYLQRWGTRGLDLKIQCTLGLLGSVVSLNIIVCVILDLLQ